MTQLTEPAWPEAATIAADVIIGGESTRLRLNRTLDGDYWTPVGGVLRRGDVQLDDVVELATVPWDAVKRLERAAAAADGSPESDRALAAAARAFLREVH